jgi:ParB/Sulfiredoxin domain
MYAASSALLNTSDLSCHDNPAGTRPALRLIDIGSLRVYEETDDDRVAELVVSLEDTKVLMNPVVVDAGRNLLIDGHHRVCAFSWLGHRRIPAYDVNYASTAVEVRGWSWSTDATPSMVRDAFAMLGSPDAGSWQAAAIDAAGDEVASHRFRGAAECARYLEHCRRCLATRGWQMDLVTPATRPFPDRIENRVVPVVGKREVLAAIHTGELYPYEVNRHLVHGRPLGMNIPLHTLRSKSQFDRYVTDVFERGYPMLYRRPTVQGTRLYEECTVHFNL